MRSIKNKVQVLSLLFLLFSLILMTSVVMAQETDRTLPPNTPVDGAISNTNPAQVYTFSAAAGETYGLIITPQIGLGLIVVLTDAEGTVLAQVIGDGSEEELTIEDVIIIQDGPHYVTIFPAAGLGAEGAFVLTLQAPQDAITEPAAPVETTAEAAEPADETTETGDTERVFQPNQQVFLPNGIQIDLVWETTDDLNLQVRDPIGGTLFWDSRTTPEGGTFGVDVNGLCGILTEPPAVETAAWGGGSLPAGSYELLIYYRQACEANNPVEFTVNVTVDGQPLPPITDVLLPPVDDVANVFISSFFVEADGTAGIGTAGPYLDTRVLDVSTDDLLNRPAESIGQDQLIQGLITNQQPYETYKFEGLSGQIITVTMNAINGSLDTLLIVMDSSGNIIAANDDVIEAVDTNSAINSLRLPTDDVYTIIATRYGKSVAGTEGNYELVISGSNIPQELTDLNLPAGDIEVTLLWETDADLQLLVRDPFGNSVYDDVPNVPSGGRITEQGNINCNIAPNQPVSYIYWPEDFLRVGAYEIEVWHQSECGTFGPTTFTLFVVVDDELIFTDTISIVFNQRYVVSFFIDNTLQPIPSIGGIVGGSETLNWQAELASAVRIASDQTLVGSITNSDKFDLYVFDGQVGDVVTIAMDATAATLDTMLFLIDPNGIEIANNDDSNETTNSLIANQVLSQDGEYIIIATHYASAFGGTVGGYNLNLRIDR